MGKRQRKSKSLKDFHDSEEEEKRNTPRLETTTDDEAEANEDLSLKVVEKSLKFRGDPKSNDGGVSEIVTLKDRVKKEKTKRRKNQKAEVLLDSVSNTSTVLKDFPGELLTLDNIGDKKKENIDETVEISVNAVESNPIEASENIVLRKLLRGPRYFDPPGSSCGACYNCGEEGHAAINCTAEKRKKPCFVCGSFEHNARQCSKGRECFFCNRQGHLAKDCPEKQRGSKLCLKCGDPGHDMFSCINDYSPDDLKEIKCYICGQFGHLCCVEYTDPGPRKISCYQCGQSGHTGLRCTSYSNDAIKSTHTISSLCYKCGLVGHFARECTSSVKVGDRNREPSTPKPRSSSKKKRDGKDVKSASHGVDKSFKKKKKYTFEEFASPGISKSKHRGGWMTEHPGDSYSWKTKPKNRSFMETPVSNSFNIYTPNGHHAASTPRFYGNNYQHEYNNSAFHGSNRFYQNEFSASRFVQRSYYSGARDYGHW